MESFETYLDRKYEELKLLDSFLDSPLPFRRPVSVNEVIEQKFRIAAALKAEHALHDWALTETAWAHPGRLRAGPSAMTISAPTLRCVVQRSTNSMIECRLTKSSTRPGNVGHIGGAVCLCSSKV
jgi:hypothetical protein